MEDYTYHLRPGTAEGPRRPHARGLPVDHHVGAASRDPPTEHRRREDPVRLVFTADPGPGVVVGLADLGDRFRFVLNAIDLVEPDEPMPKLPVAHAVWTPRPDMTTALESWLKSGGPHHTVLVHRGRRRRRDRSRRDPAHRARRHRRAHHDPVVRQRAALEPGLLPPRARACSAGPAGRAGTRSGRVMPGAEHHEEVLSALVAASRHPDEASRLAVGGRDPPGPGFRAAVRGDRRPGPAAGRAPGLLVLVPGRRGGPRRVGLAVEGVAERRRAVRGSRLLPADRPPAGPPDAVAGRARLDRPHRQLGALRRARRPVLVGPRREPDDVYPQLVTWNRSGDQWMRRISMVSLIHYSGKNAVFMPTEMVLPLVSNCLDDPPPREKAVGWVLRETGNAHPDAVGRFSRNTSTSCPHRRSRVRSSDAAASSGPSCAASPQARRGPG